MCKDCEELPGNSRKYFHASFWGHPESPVSPRVTQVPYICKYSVITVTITFFKCLLSLVQFHIGSNWYNDMYLCIQLGSKSWICVVSCHLKNSKTNIFLISQILDFYYWYTLVLKYIIFWLSFISQICTVTLKSE